MTVRTTSLWAFFLLFCVQIATLAPCLAPSAQYLPQLFVYRLGIGYLIATGLAGAGLLLGVLRAIHALGGSRRWLMWLLAGVLIVLHLTLLGAASFYGKFGTYPSPAIILDLLAAPSAFIAYTQSDTSLWDLLAFSGAAAIVIGAGVAIVPRIWLEPRRAALPAWNILLASALLLGIRNLPPPSISRQHTFMLTEHSLPSVKYTLELFSLFDLNRVDEARRYTPRPLPSPAPADIPRARHVLLIIAECLRADHLPAYGYSRDTTPFLQSESSKWLVFSHAYAHGSRTADSFPVLFNSQYFAAIDRGNEGATALWRSLRERGVGSAFLSAGAMEWGGITHSLDLRDVDNTFIASDVDPGQQRKITESPFDYSVDDSIPLGRYLQLLDRRFSGHPSFVSLHLVGSHYPFQYDDTPDAFVPSLRQVRTDLARVGESTRQVQSYEGNAVITDSTIVRVSNSYDNSIVHIDGLIRQAVEALESAGMADDSVVIVTSDHGESLGEHRTFFHGTTLYEEQVHVPLMVRIGAHLSPVRRLLEPRLTHVVGQINLMPTILHLLGGTPPSIRPFEGISLLSGSRKAYELLLFRGIGEKLAIVTDDSKYVFDVSGRLGEQYSLVNDPAELQDVWKGTETHAAQFLTALTNKGVLPPAHEPNSSSR